MTEEQSQESIPETPALRVYELGFHIVPSVEEEKIGDVVDTIRGRIEENGGNSFTEESPKKMTLAYTMEQHEAGKRHKFDSAYFGWIKFEAPKEGVVAISEQMTQDKNILRHLLIESIREHTVNQRRLTVPREAEELAREQSAPVSDEELDKVVEELVKE